MAMRLFLLAASAAAFVSAQDATAGCTAKSFSYPSWLIQDVKYAGGDVSFSLSNRVTNYTATLACQATKTGSNGCAIQGTPSPSDTLQVSVLAGESSTTFSVKESWDCNDRGKLLTFTATGSSSAALNYTSPLLVKGSLTSPVAITPSYPDGPTGHDLAGCTARSEVPSWVLSDIHFTSEPGDGVTSTPFLNFNVLVTNPGNGYQASCMPGNGFGPDSSLSRLVCAGSEFQSSSVGSFPITTQASFDPATSTFSINQTWFCDDTDAAKPLQITAAGSTTLPLTCTHETTPQNQTNSYCSSSRATLPLAGRLGTVVTLRPYALEDPVPTSRGDGCTLTSLFAPRWRFSHFQLAPAGSASSSSGSGSGAGAEVTFEMILAAADRGFQYPIPIYQGEAVPGQEGWYACVVGQDGGNGLPLWPYRCSFRYEGGEEGMGALTVKADWECRDLDRAHPVKFSGVTTTTVNSTLTCETADGESRCTTTDPGYTWSAPISNVTWGK